MFKKCIAIIIGLIFALTTNFVAVADEASEEKNDILKKCKDKKPKYEEILIEEPYDLNFRLEFEKARTAYHDYVRCVFDRATIDMLGSVSGDTKGLTNANLVDFLPKLLNPKTACIKEEGLAKIMTDGSPNELLKPLIGAYYEYVEHLKKLFEQVSLTFTFDEMTVQNFEILFSRNQVFRLIIENEIQDALIALDTSFIILKEMRQAFVMHVHFQCMLQNLELYRRVMENLRTVISALPPIIEDASMHK